MELVRERSHSQHQRSLGRAALLEHKGCFLDTSASADDNLTHLFSLLNAQKLSAEREEVVELLLGGLGRDALRSSARWRENDWHARLL